MSNIPTTITVQDVVAACRALYVNRSKRSGWHYVRSILQAYGNGARNISELEPAYYESVWRAAGGYICSAEEFYGVALDVQPASTGDNSPVKPARSNRARHISLSNSNTQLLPVRVRSPLTLALEAELVKARAKTKRSVPNFVVNIGNASRVGDQADDAPQPEYPAGERMK
jgi:hypothetical protein